MEDAVDVQVTQGTTDVNDDAVAKERHKIEGTSVDDEPEVDKSMNAPRKRNTLGCRTAR